MTRSLTKLRHWSLHWFGMNLTEVVACPTAAVFMGFAVGVQF